MKPRLLFLSAAVALACTAGFSAQATEIPAILIPQTPMPPLPVPLPDAPAAKKAAEKSDKKLKSGDYTVITIDGVRLSRSQIETEFPALARTSGMPDWDRLPQSTRDAIVSGIAHQFVLAREAEKAVKEDDPRLKARLAEAKDRIRIELYTEDMIARSLTNDMIEQEFAKRAIDHVRQRALHVRQFFTRHKWKARQAHAALKEGRSAEEVAKEMNLKTVDLGEVVRRDLIFPQVADAVMALDENDYSEPVETAFGWHIFLALDTGRASIPAREALIPGIQEELSQRLWQRHLDRLMSRASITYTDADGKKLPLPW